MFSIPSLFIPGPTAEKHPFLAADQLDRLHHPHHEVRRPLVDQLDHPAHAQPAVAGAATETGNCKDGYF